MSAADPPPDLELPTIDGLPKALVRLGLPALAEQVLAFCVSFFDVFLSGQLSQEATEAVGLAAYVGWLATMLSGLVGTGAAVLVARACGRGDFAEARRITARSLALAAVLGILLCGFLLSAAPLFVRLLGMTGETGRIAVEFLRVDAFGQMFACGTLIAAAMLRGSGDMRTPLWVLGATNLVNIAASCSCVFGWGPVPQLGVLGIVTGTLIAQFLGLMLILAALFGTATRLRIRCSDLGWHGETSWRILRIGGPAAIDGVVSFTGHFLFLMVIKSLSQPSAFAAHIVGVRVEAVSYLPAVAWGAASASLAGRFLGAGKPDLAYQTGQLAVRQFMVYSGVVAVDLWIFASPIYAFMHKDPAVAGVGVPAVRWLAFYQVAAAMLSIYVHTLRGAGDTRFPLWCALGSIFCIRVPVAWICGIYLDGGLVGAWYGMGLDNAVRMLLMRQRYRGRNWLTTRV